MAFAGVNYWAILIGALAAWAFGAFYYMILSRPWLAAQGKTADEFQAAQAGPRGTKFYAPFVISFVAEVIMGWMLAGIMAHIGAMTVRGGLISAAFVWFGFVLTTMTVNNAFSMRRPLLTVIDAVHWLGALLIIGAVIGAFGS
jgi:Protein of unknown function (DUF1761)